MPPRSLMRSLARSPRSAFGAVCHASFAARTTLRLVSIQSSMSSGPRAASTRVATICIDPRSSAGLSSPARAATATYERCTRRSRASIRSIATPPEELPDGSSIQRGQSSRESSARTVPSIERSHAPSMLEARVVERVPPAERSSRASSPRKSQVPESSIGAFGPRSDASRGGSATRTS